ncbi:hypothetical protein [Defluviitoga tunisiensis]|uniref:Uncharacterized protein n=1 Tax=Defluviitoga tunisiensis TaxID=1006576 RepID=A0A0C7P1P8_DEFTU|nr:hypothetical protein [Defluviitoga tunisiensis]CEP77909.1 hypothetical protein DTL3_0592 [Defluviitoga tunisiensis]
MKKITLFLYLSAIFISGFASARLLSKNDPEYYYQVLNGVNLKYPIYYESENIPKEYRNYIHTSIDLKYENRIIGSYTLEGGWYRPSNLTDILFRDFVLKNGNLFNFGFKTYYGNNFFAQFIADFRLGDTTYFKYGNYNIFNIPRIDYISLDFPTFSYLSYKKDKMDFLIGRIPLSYGPMKYNLVLSDNSPYYDTMNISYSFSDNLSYDFAILSMVPQLSKDEQEKMEEKYIASRNAFYNGINYKFNENLFFGLSSLNQVAGKLPNPINIFVKSDVGIYGGYLKLIPFYDINFNGEYAINYNTLKSSYGLGVSKTFRTKSSRFKVGYERYWIEDNFFSNEKPYQNLYYRTIALSNEPGARIFFDYPFGFKYGENSKIGSLELILAFEKASISYIWDNGTNSFGKLNNHNISFLWNTKIGKIGIDWMHLKNAENEFETFNLKYLFEVNIRLPK